MVTHTGARIASLDGKHYEIIGRSDDGRRLQITDNAGHTLWADADENTVEGTPWYARDRRVAYELGEARWQGGLLGGCWMVNGKPVQGDLLGGPPADGDQPC